MTRLHASLLGGFGLASGDGRPVQIETRKARALLAVLLMAKGRPIRRERLANLLWSRSSTRQSLASLSQALYSLRRALEEAAPDLIDARPDTVSIDAGQVTVDVWDMEAAHADGGQAARRRCLELYAGSFLDDLAIDTEEGYAEWRDTERARLEGVAVQAGTDLMERWERAPDEANMALVDRLLAVDPFNEPAMRVRMMVLARSGRAAAAIAAADGFAATLSSDLGIAPSTALADLAARIREGAFDPAPLGPVGNLSGRPKARLVVVAAVAILAVALLWTMLVRDAAPETGPLRLLVRPFEAEDGVAPDLARGFSDDLSTALVRRTALDVLSRESGRLVAEGQEAANGASHVLRGRVRGDGGRWVLNVWIIETATEREVWADRFTASAAAPRDVQGEIVARIADGIGVELAALPSPVRPRLPETAVPVYLGALSRLYSGSPVGNAEALERFDELVRTHPGAVEPVAGLVVALERVAFEADDYAREAGLHWLEGYLRLKQALATAPDDHPDILAARARLAQRRLDHAAAQSLARRALDIDGGHVAALAVLSRSLALTGVSDTARHLATRTVELSPAAPQDGYLSLALAAFAEEDLPGASEAIETAMQTTRALPVQLLALRAAVQGTRGDTIAMKAAHRDLVQALESRPFGAWRIGEVAFSNPRAATWRRPTATEAASLVRFEDPEINARVQQGMVAAFGASGALADAQRPVPLTGAQIEADLFNRRIDGQRTWIALEGWSQVRTPDGALFQEGAFGPLPQARTGQSIVIADRLCDRWTWRGTEIENCQLVMRLGRSGAHLLVGETGWFPFVIAGPP